MLTTMMASSSDAHSAETPSAERVSVLGVPVTDVTMDDALRLIDAMIATHPPRSHSVYFVNAHTLNLATSDPSFREVLRAADRVFGDGTGVRWAARVLHQRRLRDNVNGTDFVPMLFSARANRGHRYFLVGTTPERIERAAKFTQQTFPGWTLAGYHHGYLRDDDSERIVAEINRAQPHVLLVGMGNPLQERWIHRHLPDLRVPVCMGVGGLFDFWSGDRARAPAWVRKIGCEWVHVLIREPGKNRRYLVGNPLFLLRVAARLVQGDLP